jgi:dGTPase
MRPHPSGEGWLRHPLAHLVEAADDICYLIADFEDGAALGLLDPDEAEAALQPIARCQDDPDIAALTDTRARIAALRSRAITRLVEAAAEAFVARIDPILDGTFPGDLIATTEHGPAMAEIRAISRSKLYRSQRRLEIDMLGQTVLTRLLETYLGAFRQRQRRGRAPLGLANRRVLQSFPHAELVGTQPSAYVRAVLDHIAGMTDRTALATARLFGADVRLAIEAPA